MKYFGIRYSAANTRKDYLRMIRIPFLILSISAFVIFSLYHNLYSIIFMRNKIDVFSHDLQQIALYFWLIDKSFATFLIQLDDIVRAYKKGNNILVEKEDAIEYVWHYIYNNSAYLSRLGFQHYDTLMAFISDARKYKDDIFDLLGKNEPQHYLVILQNSNEKRPNGGFFGSFAFIQVYQARIQQLQVIDSYFVDYISKTKGIIPPRRAKTFLPENKIAFVAANRFGFTPIDGNNIKTLYETIFHGNYDSERVKKLMDTKTFEMLVNKNIKGVLFIDTKLLELLLPSIKRKIREWQFVNAAIDIIRGENRMNKKEIYLQEVNTFFRQNASQIMQAVVNKFSDIIYNSSVQIYLSNTRSQIHGLLQKRNMMRVYDPQNIYARDINDSYNKIDGFIQKKIEIIDENNLLVKESEHDRISLSGLQKGKYTLLITYYLYVPTAYKNFIRSLEKKYNIQLGNREKIILGLMPNIGLTAEGGLRYRTRSVVYLPWYVRISKNKNPGYRSEFFSTPFAQGRYYNMRIGSGEDRKSIQIDFYIK